MKKITQTFLKFVLILFAIALSWIILSGFVDYKYNVYQFNPIFVGIGVTIYVLAITFVYKYVFILCIFIQKKTLFFL